MPAARRLIAALAAPLLAALAFLAATAAAGPERTAVVGGGTVQVDATEERDTLAGRAAPTGARWLLLAGTYRRADDALPALLESGEEAFRLVLDDGGALAPDPLTRELPDGWWGPLDVFPAEERPFTLAFALSVGASPRALRVRLEGSVAEIALAPSPVAAGTPDEVPERPAAEPPAGNAAASPAPATGPEGGRSGAAEAEAVEAEAPEAAAEAPREAAAAPPIPAGDAPPAIPPPPAAARNVLSLAGVVTSIEGTDAPDALMDGRTGPGAPVAHPSKEQPLVVMLAWPVPAERVVVIPRMSEVAAYALRLEVSPDGRRWETVDEVRDGWRGPLRVALGGRAVRALRLSVTGAREGTEVPALEEIELWSRAHVPALHIDLAQAAFGARIVSVTPPAEDATRPASRLIDGDPGSWWGGRSGAAASEIVLALLENRAFAVDAVRLHLDPGSGLPTRLVVSTSLEGPDRGFEPAGSFDVPAEADPLFVFPPRPARWVKLRVEGPRGGERIWIAELAVFEAEGEGLPSKFATLAAIPTTEPPAERNLADWHNGGDLVSHPPLGEDLPPWDLHDGSAKGKARSFQAGENAFLFEFLGGRRARVDEMRLFVTELAAPGRVRVELGESRDGPFLAVADRLLPPGRGWRGVAFAPHEARYVRVVVAVDPAAAERVGLSEIAVLERPHEGEPSIVEVPPEERRPLGPNVALAVLGGEVVRVSAEEQHRGWSARRLIDGLVADFWYASRGSLGFVTPEESDWPVEVELKLAGSRPVRIAGVGIDPRVKIYESGILDTDFRGTSAYRPRRFEVEVSLDGTGWRRVLTGVVRPRWVRQTFRLPQPVEARFVRFRFLEHYGGPRLALGELEVYEDPDVDPARSVLADLEVNLARPELGGAVVTVSSQYAGGKAYVGNLFDGNPKSIWSPGDGWRWPQKVTLAFAGERIAEIAALELVPREPAYRPKTVAVRATTGDDPTRGFELVGRFEAPADTPLWRITFGRPVRARFLEVSFVEGFDPRRLGLAELRVIEARRPGYRPVLARAATGADVEGETGAAENWAVEATQEEREPNDEPSQATPVAPGEGVAGRIDPPGERDHFLLDVEAAAPVVYRFLAEGRPALRTRIEFEGRGGASTALDPGGAPRIEGSVLLSPGGHLLRFHEPPTRIVLVIDTSGSMRESVDATRTAIEGFLAGMGEGEEVALVTFASDVRVVQDFTRDRDVLTAKAREAIGAEGGTALYEAMMRAAEMLADWPGNRAVVLLSDGADSASDDADAAAVFRALAERGIRFYAVALGTGMERYAEAVGTTPRRMLGYWARVGHGATLATPAPDELKRLYARIGQDLRSGTRYRFRFVPETGTGRLVVRETGERIPGVGVPDRILFVLDASGSMRGRDREGAVKMETARRVLVDLVRALPEDVLVGLRVYGHRLPRKPKARSCTDSELVVPFGRIDRDAFAAFVQRIRPRGQTPIGLSLAQVARDFGNTPGRKVVVLITDGEETCATDPADPLYPPAVVEELKRRGVDVQLQIVGFDIAKPEVRAFLTDLAERTGGRFHTADDAAGLARALEEALKARFVVRDLLGQSVADGVLDGGAVELPAGLYTVEVASTRPLVIRDVRIEAGRETRLDIDREGEEIAVDRSIGEPSTPLAGSPVARETGPAQEGPEEAASTAAAARMPADGTAIRDTGPRESPPGATGSREERVAMLLADARRLVAEKKLTTPPGESALSRYRAVLALDPGNAEAKAGIDDIVRTYVRWAEAAETRGDLRKAETYYGRALEAAPEDVRLLALRGLTRLQLGRFDEAAADFARAGRLAPDDPRFAFYEGFAWFQAGEAARALDPLARAWESDFDERDRAGYLRAGALARLQRFEEAYRQLLAAIRARGTCEDAPLDATCSAMWTTMVGILRAMGRDDAVMETLIGLLDLEPADPDLYTAIAETLRANGREEEARRIEERRRARFGR